MNGVLFVLFITLCIAVLFFAIAFKLYQQSEEQWFHLVLSTSSGEVQAATSKDRDSILRLRDEIEKQIVASN